MIKTYEVPDAVKYEDLTQQAKYDIDNLDEYILEAIDLFYEALKSPDELWLIKIRIWELKAVFDSLEADKVLDPQALDYLRDTYIYKYMNKEDMV